MNEAELQARWLAMEDRFNAQAERMCESASRIEESSRRLEETIHGTPGTPGLLLKVDRLENAMGVVSELRQTVKGHDTALTKLGNCDALKTRVDETAATVKTARSVIASIGGAVLLLGLEAAKRLFFGSRES